MRKKIFTCLCLSFIFLLAFRPLLQAQYWAVAAFRNLAFSAPIEMVSPNDGTNRLFVVSQSGFVWVFPNNPSASTSKVFLNISNKILNSGEQGLLGLAFHPDYRHNGYFYVNYVRSTPQRQTVIARYQVTANNPDLALAASETILFTIDQPYVNHKGGKLTFGNDGYLYIATGDGGSGGDPENNSQNRTSLLGKILRIDVNAPSGILPYSIPADNPYAGNTQGFREEIFAYGLRNPWKISVDKPTGRIWAGDVGQSAREEIDIIEKGGNYGWRLMEGTACYNPIQNCNQSGLTLPVWDYPQGDLTGRSITGGLVYRGSILTGLRGKYIYGDFVSGNVWALTYNPNGQSTNELLFNMGVHITAFGEDANGEIYVCYYSGAIRKIYDLRQTTYLTSPAGGSTNVALSTGLYAAFVPGATSYTFELNPDPGFTAATSLVRTSTNRYVFISSGLQYATTYYVRVKTNLSPAWGVVKNFTVLAAPLPLLTSPAGGSTNVPRSTGLYAVFVPGATSYTFEINPDAGFSAATSLVRTSTNRYVFISSGLQYATTYYVRVKTNLSPAWGAGKSFTVVAAPAGRMQAASGESKEVTWKVSPNPFTEQLQVMVNTAQEEPLELTLTDLQGRVLYSSTTHSTNRVNQLGKELSAGVYVLRAISATEKKIVKVVKLP